MIFFDQAIPHFSEVCFFLVSVSHQLFSSGEILPNCVIEKFKIVLCLFQCIFNFSSIRSPTFSVVVCLQMHVTST